MTFDDDHIRLNLEFLGPRTLFLKDVGLSWPPPERLWWDKNGLREATDDDPIADLMYRKRYSSTDEQRASMSNVARGAEYCCRELVSGD